MAKMQDIVDARDQLREEVENLDGGYATVGRILNKSKMFVHKTLAVNNMPRITTLEEIKDAVEQAKRKQKVRLESLKA